MAISKSTVDRLSRLYSEREALKARIRELSLPRFWNEAYLDLTRPPPGEGEVRAGNSRAMAIDALGGSGSFCEWIAPLALERMNKLLADLDDVIKSHGGEV